MYMKLTEKALEEGGNANSIVVTDGGYKEIYNLLTMRSREVEHADLSATNFSFLIKKISAPVLFLFR